MHLFSLYPQDRGYANYDRIRAHFRRCDEWKGYMSGRTTVDDTYGVLNTLSLRTIRKETFMTLIKMFERAEHETGDKEYALASESLFASPPSPLLTRPLPLLLLTPPGTASNTPSSPST